MYYAFVYLAIGPCFRDGQIQNSVSLLTNWKVTRQQNNEGFLRGNMITALERQNLFDF